MMTPNVRKFDTWIRTSFCEMNTELEELYFAQADRAATAHVGAAIKARLCQEGEALIAELVKEGNTDEGFDQDFSLLGDVGFYMAACRRHEISEADAGPAARLRQASALALELGAALGVTPRFATSHLTTHNPAVNGRYKSFTTLDDEYIFIDYNTRGILAYKRAADALLRIQPMGVSHPVTPDLLRVAKDALNDVITNNSLLNQKLDQERFFYNVRPYYKPHPVGFNVYRGANAGDFAGINVVDLLLGVCQSNQSSYSQLLVDKFLYMMPSDQLILRDCMRQQSLLNQFLAALPMAKPAPWFRQNVAAFLEVCAVHGTAATQHHNLLVERYIKQPAVNLAEEHQTDLTASGPPLPVLLASLEKLRDQRTAAPRTDIYTRHADLERLRAAIAG